MIKDENGTKCTPKRKAEVAIHNRLLSMVQSRGEGFHDLMDELESDGATEKENDQVLDQLGKILVRVGKITKTEIINT